MYLECCCSWTSPQSALILVVAEDVVDMEVGVMDEDLVGMAGAAGVTEGASQAGVVHHQAPLRMPSRVGVTDHKAAGKPLVAQAPQGVEGVETGTVAGAEVELGLQQHHKHLK